MCACFVREDGRCRGSLAFHLHHVSNTQLGAGQKNLDHEKVNVLGLSHRIRHCRLPPYRYCQHHSYHPVLGTHCTCEAENHTRAHTRVRHTLYVRQRITHTHTRCPSAPTNTHTRSLYSTNTVTAWKTPKRIDLKRARERERRETRSVRSVNINLRRSTPCGSLPVAWLPLCWLCFGGF